MARVEHAKVWAGLSEIGVRDMPAPQATGSYVLAPAARSLQQGEHWALESVGNLSSNGQPVESDQEEIYWKQDLVSEEQRHCHL
ncbi:hypothetical protein H9Q70_014681, partial [Fusarium xylarioides]